MDGSEVFSAAHWIVMSSCKNEHTEKKSIKYTTEKKYEKEWCIERKSAMQWKTV